MGLWDGWSCRSGAIRTAQSAATAIRRVGGHEDGAASKPAKTAPPGACPRHSWSAYAGGLSGAGAEREGDVPPGVEVRGRGRQVQDDPADRTDHVGPQFEQPVAQPRHLGAGTCRTRRAQPEFLHEHVGRSGEEDAQLIDPEATAARPADLEAVVQLFDAILDVAPRTVDPFVEEPGRLAQIGDDEARIVLGLAAGELDDFRFDEDPARRGAAHEAAADGTSV